MLARLARHELRLLRRDTSLHVVLALLAGVTLVAAQHGGQAARARVAEQARVVADHRAQMATFTRALETAPAPGALDPRSPRDMGGVAQPLVLPVAPLAALAIGQSDLLPSLLSASHWSAAHTLARNYEVENPALLASGRFDLAFVVVWLLPLFMLATTYDVVTGGREDGTWALAFSQPVRPRALILGRLLPRIVVVVGATLGLSLLGAVVAGVPLGAADARADLASWCALVTAYALFWCGLGLALAVGARSSAQAALRLAVAWLVLVVLVPAALNLLAAGLHPTPSRLAFIQDTRAAANEAHERATGLLTDYYADHPELVPAGSDPDLTDFMTRFLTISADVHRQVEPLRAEYERRLERQHELLHTLRFASPAALLQAAFVDLAGNDGPRLRAFQSQARAFLDAWKAFFTPRIFARQTLDARAHAAWPRFRFAEEPRGAQRARTLLAWAALALPALLLFGLAAWRLGRQRPADF
jgi:ABC-2 type transport system permease protein